MIGNQGVPHFGKLFQFANARLCTNRNISSFRLILFFAKLDDFACFAKFIFCVISGNLSRTEKIIIIILRKLSLFHDFSNLKSRAKFAA